MATESDDGSPQGPDEERAPPKYRDKRTARFANGERVREFQAFEEQTALKLSAETARGSSASASISSGASALSGRSTHHGHSISKLLIITEGELP
jgi:hypothetical protein